MFFQRNNAHVWTNGNPVAVQFFSKQKTVKAVIAYSWVNYLNFTHWYSSQHSAKRPEIWKLQSKGSLNGPQNVYGKLMIIDKNIYSSTQHGNCSVLMLWHKSHPNWQKISCHQKTLDKGSVFCMSKEKPRANKILKVQFSKHKQNTKHLTNVFQCTNGSIISSFFMCHGKPLCLHGDDEMFCQNNRTTFLVTNILSGEFVSSTNKPFNREHLISSSSPTTVGDTETKPCSLAPNCIYDLRDKQGRMLKYCEDGEHLQECTKFHCNTTFKCPMYYCLPWRYVCDGYWDCPFGYDENSCNPSFKEGFYHCGNSSIFLTEESICDKILDCPKNDDETGCDLHSAVCPEVCFCIQYSILCNNIVTPLSFGNYFAMPYRLMFLSHSCSQCDILLLVKPFPHLIFLKMSFNVLPNLCFSAETYHFKDLIWFKASDNDISMIGSYCMGSMPKLKDINLAQNCIVKLYCNALAGLSKVMFLNLSRNNIKELKQCHVSGLTDLKFLDLSFNQVFFIDIDLFYSLNHNHIYIKSSIETFCCFASNIHCSVEKDTMCSHLLANSVLFYFLSMSITGTVSNVFVMIRNVIYVVHTPLGPAKNYLKRTYTLLVMSTQMSSIFICMMILQVSFADISFGDSFPFKKVIWVQSPFCLVICFFFYLSIISNVSSIQLVAVSRSMVVLFPLESKFKNWSFMLRVITQMYLVELTISSVMTFAVSLLGSDRMPMDMCWPVGKLQNTILSTINFLLLFVTTLTSLASVPFLYARIVCHVNEQHVKTAFNCEKSKRKSIAAKAILACVFHLICYLPLSVALVVPFAADSCHEELTVWSVAVILTLNSLIYPVFLEDNLKKFRFVQALRILRR